MAASKMFPREQRQRMWLGVYRRVLPMPPPWHASPLPTTAKASLCALPVRLAAKDCQNERNLLTTPEALDLYKKSNQILKCELVEEKPTEPMVSFYTTGKFIDFCRGPHIPSTKRIQAFKLMNVAGAYWKGQE